MLILFARDAVNASVLRASLLLRYRRSVGEAGIPIRSSNPIIYQDLVVIVGPIFFLGNSTRVGNSHTDGLGRQLCSV